MKKPAFFQGFGSSVKNSFQAVIHNKKTLIWLGIGIGILVALSVAGIQAKRQAGLDISNIGLNDFDFEAFSYDRLGGLDDTLASACRFQTEESEPEAIARAAAEHYFGAFMAEEIPLEYRIDRFKLRETTFLDGDSEEFTVAILFDLETAGSYFNTAASTTLEDGGYLVENITRELRLTRLGGGYYQTELLATDDAAEED